MAKKTTTKKSTPKSMPMDSKSMPMTSKSMPMKKKKGC
jgi:hypothetical protein